MNYIEQIRGFWRSHEIDVFPTNVIALYFYLLEVNNKASWVTSFKRNNSKVCADLGMSYPTLNNARNRLKQAGLVDFATKNGSANVTYTLKDFLKVGNEVENEVSDEVSIEVGDEVLLRSFKTKDKLNRNQTKQKNDKAFVPPTIEDVQLFFEEKGYSRDIGARAWDYYSSAQWQDSKGKPVRNWKQKMIAVWFKPENRVQGQQVRRESNYTPSERDQWN